MTENNVELLFYFKYFIHFEALLKLIHLYASCQSLFCPREAQKCAQNYNYCIISSEGSYLEEFFCNVVPAKRVFK